MDDLEEDFQEYLQSTDCEKALWEVLIDIDNHKHELEDPVEYMRQNLDPELTEKFKKLKNKITAKRDEISQLADEYPVVYQKFLKWKLKQARKSKRILKKKAATIEPKYLPNKKEPPTKTVGVTPPVKPLKKTVGVTPSVKVSSKGSPLEQKPSGKEPTKQVTRKKTARIGGESEPHVELKPSDKKSGIDQDDIQGQKLTSQPTLLEGEVSELEEKPSKQIIHDGKETEPFHTRKDNTETPEGKIPAEMQPDMEEDDLETRKCSCF